MTTNKLILAGQQLSNICYNLCAQALKASEAQNIKQDSTLPQHVRESMERCVREWDEALREVNSIPKAKDSSDLYSLGKYISENLK